MMKKNISNNNNMYILQLLLLGIILVSEVVANNSSLAIHSFSVMSDIKYRYATTRVETVFNNIHESSALAVFYVNIPENAFVSNFTMEVNGSVFVGEILEKEKAKAIYDKAEQLGETAAYVGTEHRHTNLFKVMVSVEAKKTAVFRLIYQELLRRTFGKYRHVIHLTNKQIIENFKIEVFITELQSITLSKPELKPDSLKLKDNSLVEAAGLKDIGNIEYLSSKQLYIEYKPSVADQKKFSTLGITGVFEVNYDVDWKESPNMIYAIDGYFVHFYVPDSYPFLQKNIIFMLDVSGSMEGNKLKQMKEAMYGILHSLKEAQDTFLVGIFSSDVMWMNDDFLPANSKYINAALKYIDNLSAEGGTNIYDALQSSLRTFLNRDSSDTKNIIFFLTDGAPTSGITNLNHIIRDVNEANSGTSIFTLGFGGGSNMNFLKQLAVENGGFSRKIYVAADSQMQILNLYREISSILLKNINIVYLDDAINQTTLTENSFSYYFKGSEIVVSGVISKQFKEDINVLLTMDTLSGHKSVTLKLPVADLDKEFQLSSEDILQNPKLTTLQSLHKITRNTWVHLTLKRLLNLERTPEIEKQIISIALRYGFVTPLTSMVVVQNREMNMIKRGSFGRDSLSVERHSRLSSSSTHCFISYLLLVSSCFQMCFWNW